MEGGYGTPFEFRKCALEPLNSVCQIYASLSSSSISFSVHSRVGSDCRNIMISYRVRVRQLEPIICLCLRLEFKK